MTISFQLPPTNTPDDLVRYLQKLVESMNSELEGINQVIVRNELPDRPFSGRIYYLKSDVNDPDKEGFWVFVSDVWHKLDSTEVVI